MGAISYSFVAVDQAGKRRKGAILAKDEADAYRRLSGDGLTPLRVSARSSSRGIFRRDRVTQADVAALTRELSVLCQAKIPIGRGLLAIAEHEPNKALREMVHDIASRIEAGEKITAALSHYQDTFGEVYIETMRAAEMSGTLAEITEHLASMLEKGIETRQMVRRALSYPVIVLCVVAIALTVIVVFVVPKFAGIFAQNGVELPITTRVVKAVGDSVKAYWWAYAGGLAASAVALVRTWKHPRGRLVLESLLLRLPYAGRLIVAATTARFSRVLAVSLNAGLDIIESLGVAGRSTGRPRFVHECDRMADRVRSGDTLGDVLKTSEYLPNFARRMIGAGKDSQEVGNACRIISRHYERESDHLAKNVNTIVEPLMTVALAMIVLLIALSVFLPMWQMMKINK